MIRSIFFATSAVLSLTSVAFADETVSVDRAAMADASYKAELYERIEKAAMRACRKELRGEMFAPYLLDKCVRGAISGAVDQVGDAELTAIAEAPVKKAVVASK
ncbi:MAG: UrcA family protein [Pseudomonadota bacterium]